MHFSRKTSDLTTLLLLSSIYLAQAAPRTDIRTLELRALEARTDDPPALPAPKDDDLPQGDGKDLLAWSDDDYAGEDYKNFPDYDPDQDTAAAGKLKKRLVGFPRGLPSAKGDPTNPNQGGTRWLRSVGIDGVAVGKAFRDATSGQKYVGLTGTYGKTQQLGIEGTKTPFVEPNPKPDGYQTWQADHILDLGLLVNIATQNTPNGINEDSWQKITDAVIGDEDDEEPSQDTKDLAKYINTMSNLRGITYPINQFKNSIMIFAYSGQTTKPSYKSWDRSSVWGVYRYMRGSSTEFAEVKTQVCAEIAFLVDDDDQGTKIGNYYSSEIDRMYNKAMTELRRILATPPADNDSNSVFKTEDCINDVNSPKKPPAGGSSATAASPAPTGTQPPPQANPVCDQDYTFSLADTQAIYNQLKGGMRSNSQVALT
ncbi:hypothetical protein P7C71_g3414, partial [Lecanoromycetidae sp. Uapishka_2]